MDFIEQGSGEKTILLFHGYGADMHDLSGLATAVPNSENFRWVFPNGIRQVEIGPGFFGRAWYPINIQEFERAMREGRTRDLSKHRPNGLDKALEESEAFIDSLKIKGEDLILGGFSQGAMLALEIAARRRDNVNGVVLLSGSLMDEANVAKLAANHKGQSFYQSHGTHDPILSHEQAKRLEEMLLKAEWTGSLDSFRGGHEIPYTVIQNLGHFLKQRCQ